MRSVYEMNAAAMAGMALLSTAALAQGTVDTFGNGQSFYGRPAAAAAATRVEELGERSKLFVPWGETVTFRSQGQQFSWTFDGLDLRRVDVAKFAPAGFAGAGASVHVGKNPLNRGGRP